MSAMLGMAGLRLESFVLVIPPHDELSMLFETDPGEIAFVLRFTTKYQRFQVALDLAIKALIGLKGEVFGQRNLLKNGPNTLPLLLAMPRLLHF